MTEVNVNTAYYTERYRPQFHFSPERNWMNDPNGMVYYDGEYHLFYQYHPHSTQWGPMHWGHAVSKDLVTWEHLPVAIEPDANGMVFSGSAVVDWNDTSGFFNGGQGLVAIFTQADTYPDSGRPRQRQSIAYSLDHGRAWKMYKGNPVLSDTEITDFRDPKVFWHKETQKWVMIIAAGQSVRIYTSPNLIEWEFASSFGEMEGSHAGVWECPDLFLLPLDEAKNSYKWVMIVSIGDDPSYEEGSRTQYFIGDFDGKTFTNENSPDTILWLDHGRDNYAGVSWSDVPVEDGRKIYIGWMSNWRYANETPTSAWRSSMTLPRELSLKTTCEGIRITQKPVKELQKLRGIQTTLLGQNINDVVKLSELDSTTFELIAEFEPGLSSGFGFHIHSASDEKVTIGYDMDLQEIFIDRSIAGENSFHPDFACKHGVELSAGNIVKFHIYLDHSSVEVFMNDGDRVLTDLIFPQQGQKDIVVYSLNGVATLKSLCLYPLRSIWQK